MSCCCCLLTVTGMPGPRHRSAAAAGTRRAALSHCLQFPAVHRGSCQWVSAAAVGAGARSEQHQQVSWALRLHIHTQQQLLYLIDFLNILNFLAAIRPWHQTYPNSQIKVKIWICEDRYLHQDNSDRQPGHDAICADIGSVCNANYRCQIIIFITLGRGHYTSDCCCDPSVRSSSLLSQ